MNIEFEGPLIWRRDVQWIWEKPRDQLGGCWNKVNLRNGDSELDGGIWADKGGKAAGDLH